MTVSTFVGLIALAAIIIATAILFRSPTDRKRLIRAVGIFSVVGIAIGGLAMMPELEVDCRNKLDCWAKKHMEIARKECGSSMALRYSDGGRTIWGGELFFTHWEWLEGKERGVISYWGEKVRLRDGREVYHSRKYNCRYDPEHDIARMYLD